MTPITAHKPFSTCILQIIAGYISIGRLRYLPHPYGDPSTIIMNSTVCNHFVAPAFNVNIPNVDSTRAVMLGFGVGYLRYTEYNEKK